MSEQELYTPINCDDYESLEQACMRHLSLNLHLKNGETFDGQALDLVLRKQVEYLLLQENQQQREIRLDRIDHFSHPDLGTIHIRE